MTVLVPLAADETRPYWSALPFGPSGGPVGMAALTERPVAEGNLRASAARAGPGRRRREPTTTIRAEA